MKMSLWWLLFVSIIGFSLADHQQQVRLVNGSSRCAGRVEVFYQNRWGAVCDDGWDSRRGQVVCRQLDCGVVLSAPGNAAFGRGSGDYWMDDVTCNGNEGLLSECQAKPWGSHDCRIGEEASAVCSGDLPKPNISLSTSSSGSLQLNCTVPPLHQNTTVYFYQGNTRDPIAGIDLSRIESVAVHSINESHTLNREGYQCQYDVGAARTAQIFKSPRSDTMQREIHSAQVTATVTAHMVTVLTASIFAAVVVLVVVAAGLAFFFVKRRKSACSVTQAGTANENTYEVKFRRDDKVNNLNFKARGPISRDGGVINGSASMIHQHENRDMSGADDGPGMPHIYGKINLPSLQAGTAYANPMADLECQPNEDNEKYENVISNPYMSQSDSSKAEPSVYEAICMDMLEENLYSTLNLETATVRR